MDINMIQAVEKYLDIGVILFCLGITLVFLWNKFFKNKEKFNKKNRVRRGLNKF